ncbi:MAG: hypothetical protein WC799_25700 [Desulfobacteraceae bacterium]|jgi:hypothetical protein
MTLSEAIHGLSFPRQISKNEVAIETHQTLVLEEDKKQRRMQMDGLWQEVRPTLMNGEMTLDEVVSGLGAMTPTDRRKVMSSFKGKMKTEETRVFAREIKDEENCWSGLYENMRGSGVSPMKAARRIYSARLKVVNSLQQNIPEGDRAGQKLEEMADYISQAENIIAKWTRDEFRSEVKEHGSIEINLTELASVMIVPEKAVMLFAGELESGDSCWSGLYVNMRRSGVSPTEVVEEIYAARLKVVGALQQNITEEDRSSQNVDETARIVNQAEAGVAYEIRDEYQEKVQDHGPKGIKLTELKSVKIESDDAERLMTDASDVLSGKYDPTVEWVKANSKGKQWLGIGVLATIAAVTYAVTQLRDVEHGTFLDQASQNIGLIGFGSLPVALMVAAKSYFDRIRR